MMKHTPGPWEAVPNGGDDPSAIRDCVIDEHLDLIATVARVYSIENEGWNDNTTTANAKLIAAAPTMFDYIEYV